MPSEPPIPEPPVPEPAADVPRPFRTIPTRRRHLASGRRRWHPPATESEKMTYGDVACAGKGTPQTTLARWMRHPHEALLVLLLRHGVWQATPWSRCTQWFEAQVYQDALTDAATRGLHWTPALDWLAYTEAWPDQDAVTKPRRAVRGDHAWQPVSAVVDRLLPWLAAHPAARDRLPLLQFEAYAVIRRALDGVTDMTPEFVTAVMKRPAALAKFTRETPLSPESRARIASWALKQLRSGRRDSVRYGHYYAGEHAAYTMEGARVWRALMDTEPPDIPSALPWATLATDLPGKDLPSVGLHRRERHLRRLEAVADILVHATRPVPWPPAVWQRLCAAFLEAATAKEGRRHLLTFAHAAVLPPDALVLLAETSRGQDLRLILAKSPHAATHMPLRHALRRYAHDDLLMALAPTAPGHELRTTVRRVLAHDETAAVKLLRSLPPEQLAQLQDDDLTSLLLSEDAEHRLYAITLVHEVAQAPLDPAVAAEESVDDRQAPEADDPAAPRPVAAPQPPAGTPPSTRVRPLP